MDDEVQGADYTTVETSLVARLGIDIHKLTAAKMFDVDPDKVTREQRKAAKRASFAALYGGGTLSETGTDDD